jgi:hypothetical protein
MRRKRVIPGTGHKEEDSVAGKSIAYSWANMHGGSETNEGERS